MRLPTLLACVLVLAPAWVLAQLPQLPVPPAPQLNAKAYLLYDYQSRQVIAAHNADERMDPASLTKLMTSYLAYEALREKRLDAAQTLPVSTRAWRAEGSRMFIEPRKPVTVEQLLHGVVVQSGNDACIALAEGIAGSEEEFAELMNREAQRLGLANTHFANSTGLPHPQHYSTARDLAALAAALIRDFPDHYPLYALKEYKYNNIVQANRNRLLWSDPTVDGMKTGYTESAGYCLVSSARRNDRRLIAVVLGAPSESARATESQKLLNYGFQFFDTVRLYEKGQAIAELPVWKGEASAVKAGFADDFFVTVPRGRKDGLKASLETQQPLLAPVSAGARVGTMKLTLDGKPFSEVPVVALQAVKLGSILRRGWDALRLLFK
ncbi:MAG TPA: D-alanyl-D-alanine carboxypeptidase family protein [Burkholderiales bacterium]|nr:D-alanyl-D-alanine carboxypeptidase family protein [Burkholderiales bacterium]